MLATGTLLGPFEIIAPLGAGGMGEVYRARDTRLKRDVAIKILPAGFAAEPERRRRFEQEARAASALSHPNILVLFEIGSHEDQPYLVTELLEGETLQERLAREKRMPLRKLVEIGIQVSRGLAAAHQKGIVHRDLKPGNIFLTVDGHAKILDFGLARAVSTPEEREGVSSLPTSDQTEPGRILGTVGYMSPEQVRGETVDQRSDIFALGCIFYEMESGKRAFQKATAVETMSAILNEQPAEWSDPDPDRQTPPALSRIVQRCLEKNPAERFQSASDLAFHLETLSGSDSARQIATSSVLKTRSYRRSLAMGIWGLLIGALATFIVLSLIGSDCPRPAPATLWTLPYSTDAYLAPYSPRISPDGKYLGFLAYDRVKGDPGVFVHPMAGSDWIHIAGSEFLGAAQSQWTIWSQKSDALYLYGRPKLMIAHTTDWRAEPVCDNVQLDPWLETNDGQLIGSAIFPKTGVYSLNPETCQEKAIDIGVKDFSNRPEIESLLPDGKRLLFFEPKDDIAEINAVDLESKKVSTVQTLKSNRISGAVMSMGYLIYGDNGLTVAQKIDVNSLKVEGKSTVLARSVNSISASDNGLVAYQENQLESRLVWVDEHGVLAGDPVLTGAIARVALSPDSSRVAVVLNSESDQDLWIKTLNSPAIQRLTSTKTEIQRPIWFPDGKRILIREPKPNMNAAADLVILDARTGDRHVLYSGIRTIPMDISSDGSKILVAIASGQSDTDLSILDSTGGTPVKVVTVRGNVYKMAAGFSPDGHYLAYHTNDSGTYQVFVRPYPDVDVPIQVSDHGGQFQGWAPDGKSLFYWRTGEDQSLTIWKVSVSQDAKGIHFSTPRQYFAHENLVDFFPARDGRSLVALDDPQKSQVIRVLLNWPSLVSQPQQ